jgi:KICSTOR complex C12orf66 like
MIISYIDCFLCQTLKTVYNCILTELKKIETAHSSLVPADGSLEQLIGRLAGLLQHFITARIKTIGLYP